MKKNLDVKLWEVEEGGKIRETTFTTATLKEETYLQYIKIYIYKVLGKQTSLEAAQLIK